MLYNRNLLFIHSIYKGLHLLTSHSISPPNPSCLATTNMDSACVCPQSCLTVCDHMDCSPPGSSVCGIFQARILEWIAIFFSRDLPDTGIKLASPVAPALAGRFFTTETPGKPSNLENPFLKGSCTDSTQKTVQNYQTENHMAYRWWGFHF